MTLIVTFVLFWAGLLAICWAGTLWLQGYLYTEPTEEISWRAPAAATAVTIFTAFWIFLHTVDPAGYDTLFRFSPVQDIKPAEFVEVRNEKDGTTKEYRYLFRVPQGSGEKAYRFQVEKDAQGRPLYKSADPPYISFDNYVANFGLPDKIIFKQNGQEVEFMLERDKQGNPKMEKTQSPSGLGWMMSAEGSRALRYRDKRGHVLIAGDFESITSFRWGVLFVSLLMNMAHFGLWFALLWPVLRFQWAHALGLAFAIWLMMTVVIQPMLFDVAVPKGSVSISTAP